MNLQSLNIKDLDTLTTEQLRDLNANVVKLLRIRHVGKQLQASASLNVGQTVKFRCRDMKEHTMVITKINTKTIKGTEVDTNILWSVSPTMLKAI